jgi:hypothetical protein
VNPVVMITFERCGIFSPVSGCSTMVFGSVTPLKSTAFSRLTVPTIGLVIWWLVESPELKSPSSVNV